VKAIIRFDDDASAKMIAGMARGVLEDQAEKVDVSQDDGDVAISVTFSRDETRKLLNKLGTRW
jgi:hypothetical protein